jgi:AAA+ ATPase superfamily predicted ATPase
MAGSFVESNPYVGPQPFKRGQPLFGRAREVQELRYLLTSERIVLLYSPSGAGKSSLINAGLIPKLEQRFEVWGPTRVGAEVEGTGNRYVGSALNGLDKEKSIAPGTTWADYMKSRTWVKNPLIIFDQFEEIFRVDQVDKENQRAAFFEQTGEMLADSRIWALFVLREDYLAAMDPYARLIPSHFRNRYRLDRLDIDNAKLAIEQPT